MYTITVNTPGYLPDGDGHWDTYDTFDEARRALIAVMLDDADVADMEGRHNLAESLSAAAEDAALTNTPDAFWVLDDEDPHALWQVYEIVEVQ